MKISVVIPVYNGHKYLREAIDSVINQSYRNIEIIVVNDGSTDDGRSRSVAKQYGSKIRYIEQENRGVAGALNTGIAAMTGEIFCWLSHDDVYRPHKIERQVNFFERTGRDDVILFSNYAHIDENSKVTAEVAMERVIGVKPRLALLRGCISGCTIFLPKKMFDEIGQFNESLRYTQDYDMWKRMFAKYSFVHMADTLVNQRMHSEQGSRHPGATEEANRLWIDLVDSTSLADRVLISGSSFRFFQDQAAFLAATPYDLATAHASERASNCIETTKVSVIIPFFNEVYAAERALRSALAQTHQNIEVLMVDDGSTEDLKPLEYIAAADRRVRILRKENRGPASARNIGMSAATGEYIAFLDSDDTWMPNKIAVQTKQMQEEGYLFSHTSYNVVHAVRDLGIGTYASGKLTGSIYPEIIGQCPIATPTVMMHRALFEAGYHFPEGAKVGEDCLLWIEIAYRHPVLGIDIPLSTVEWSDTSAAINLPRSIEGLRNIRDAMSASKIHAEHVYEIAKLNRSLDYFENLRANRAREGVDADINMALMMSTLAATAGPEVDTASYGGGQTTTLSRAGRAKRAVRKVLPRPIIEVLKALNFRNLSRRVALSIPRVRRFYEYADLLAQTNEQLSATVGRLRSELSGVRATLSEAEAQRVKLEAADKERESLELQLYVLSSDFQRAVSRNEQLRTSLQDAQQTAVELNTAAEDMKTHNEVLATDFNHLQGELVVARHAAASAQGQLAELNEFRDLVATQKSELEGMKAQNEALATDVDRLQGELVVARQAAENAQQQLAELNEFRDLVAAQKSELDRRRELASDLLLSRVSIISTELGDLRQLLRSSSKSDKTCATELRLNYLQLLERALTGRLYNDEPMSPWSNGYDPDVRLMGRDWPSQAHTMIGTARMSNLRALIETVLEDGVHGDFLEAGVWRGGACIYMRGILAAHNVTDRRLWVADSFCGLPPPNAEIYPADAGDQHHTVPELAVSLEEVKSNFAKYGLLDNQVVFLPGWFKDTLATAPIKNLAVLRLDGDMYQSTIETLESLYCKVSPGGYVIVDDYILKGCRQAVDDFRQSRGILEILQPIDGASVFWRKES